MYGYHVWIPWQIVFPLRRNLHSGMPFGYTPINACFIWAIKNMAAKTVIDSHKKYRSRIRSHKYYAQPITADKAAIFSLQSWNSVPYQNHLKWANLSQRILVLPVREGEMSRQGEYIPWRWDQESRRDDTRLISVLGSSECLAYLNPDGTSLLLWLAPRQSPPFDLSIIHQFLGTEWGRILCRSFFLEK